MAENYYVHTRGQIDPSKLSAIIPLGVELAAESVAAGSERAFVGTVMTGNNAGGGVVFGQFFNSLDDFGKVMDAFAISSTYVKIMEHGMSVNFRNIAKFCDVPFSGPTDPQRKYIVYTRGTSHIPQTDLVGLITEIAPMFAESGAQSFRLARIMTGNEAGDFLLGVTYSSMEEIETTYDAIAKSPVAEKIYGSLAVNLRMIAKIQGVA